MYVLGQEVKPNLSLCPDCGLGQNFLKIEGLCPGICFLRDILVSCNHLVIWLRRMRWKEKASELANLLIVVPDRLFECPVLLHNPCLCYF